MSRKSFLLRIEQQLYDDLEAWAHQDMRSINGQMEYILKQAVSKHMGPSNKAPDHTKTPSQSDGGRKQDS